MPPEHSFYSDDDSEDYTARQQEGQHVQPVRPRLDTLSQKRPLSYTSLKSSSSGLSSAAAVQLPEEAKSREVVVFVLLVVVEKKPEAAGLWTFGFVLLLLLLHEASALGCKLLVVVDLDVERSTRQGPEQCQAQAPKKSESSHQKCFAGHIHILLCVWMCVLHFIQHHPLSNAHFLHILSLSILSLIARSEQKQNKCPDEMYTLAELHQHQAF